MLRQNRVSNFFYKTAFHTLRTAGAPLGRLRSRTPLQTACDKLARKAYPAPEDASWVKNRWGDELYLSYAYHLDRVILMEGTYDYVMHKVIERRIKPGMVCMDIGANLGEVTLHMARKVGRNGTVYSFEPAPLAYKRLISHIQRNRADAVVKAFDVALSDANGLVTFAFADENADNQALGSIVNKSRDELTRQTVVEGCTLDSFVDKYAINRIDFIKIDIQGGEWLLFEGGKRVFSELGPDLLIEISPLDLIQIGKDSRQLTKRIEAFGYGIYTLGNNGEPLRRLQASKIDPNFDCSNVLCTKA